jgi:aryl-phospho-beta-D-glucosidase BglC (GH1 family)
VGYWFLERLVEETEYFPQGGEAFLDQVVGWAKDAGLYVILGLHGAPGAQVTNAFTGQLNADPAFYHESNFDRAYQWLEWMTKKVHTNLNYSTVGMLELVNEPERVWNTAQYPDAPENALRTRQVCSFRRSKWKPATNLPVSRSITQRPGRGSVPLSHPST